MKDLEEFAKNSLIILSLMAFAWTVSYVVLGLMGVR